MTNRQHQYITQLLPSLSNAEAGWLIGHLQAVQDFKLKLGGKAVNRLRFQQTRLV